MDGCRSLRKSRLGRQGRESPLQWGSSGDTWSSALGQMRVGGELVGHDLRADHHDLYCGGWLWQIPWSGRSSRWDLLWTTARSLTFADYGLYRGISPGEAVEQGTSNPGLGSALMINSLWKEATMRGWLLDLTQTWKDWVEMWRSGWWQLPWDGGVKDPEKREQGKKQNHNPGLQERRMSVTCLEESHKVWPWRRGFRTSRSSKSKNGSSPWGGNQAKVKGACTCRKRASEKKK